MPFPAIAAAVADDTTSTEKTPPREQLRCYLPHTEQRSAVQNYIARAFQRQYGATIDHFLPHLLTLEENGVTHAAVGLRDASADALFVEHYLDRPIEQILRARGLGTQRERIIEIGNLVSTRPGGSQLLFILLAGVLEAIGSEIAVFTATPQVSGLLEKLGCQLIALAAADARCLGERQQQWGSYYDCGPSVVAIDVQTAVPRLRRQERIARTLTRYAGDIERIGAMF